MEPIDQAMSMNTTRVCISKWMDENGIKQIMKTHHIIEIGYLNLISLSAYIPSGFRPNAKRAHDTILNDFFNFAYEG